MCLMCLRVDRVKLSVDSGGVDSFEERVAYLAVSSFTRSIFWIPGRCLIVARCS